MIGFAGRYGDLVASRGGGRQCNLQSARAATVVRSAGGKTLVLPPTMVDLEWAGYRTGCAQHE
jgi:hypothetical protein